MKLLSVVMPVYNEERWVEGIIRKVMSVKVPLEVELIVVDDGSTDGTREKLENIRKQYPESVRILRHEENVGKGAALRTAFREVRGDIILVQDADLEYSPGDYNRLIGPILDGRADVVYGSRFGGEVRRVLFFWHYVGNRFLTTLSNMLTNLNLTDLEVCYKVFRREVLKDIRIRSNRFGFEPEITAKIARKKVRLYEVPVNYDGRDYSEGKKIGWKDGLKAIGCILFFRFFD